MEGKIAQDINKSLSNLKVIYGWPYFAASSLD